VRVFLHGFTGGPGSFDPLRALAPDADTHAPWLLGHGRPAQAGAATWDAEIDRLLATLDPSGRGGLDLVGYSLGARVAAGLVARHPEQVRRAVLVGPNLGLSPAERPARARWEASLCGRLRSDGVRAFVDHWEQLPLWESQHRVPPDRLAAQRAQRLTHTAEGLARSLEVMGLSRMPPLWETLRQAAEAVPLRIVVGADDRKFLDLTAPLVGAPGIQRVVVPNAGHNVVLEAPEALAEVLRWR